MTNQALIVGGGIGGLAAALACSRSGWQCRLYEQSARFSEVGAGIQLGPNATRVLAGWQLEATLRAVAAFPDELRARSATAGRQLGRLRLGSSFAKRYGAPYVTVHRADLQKLLLDAARGAGAQLKLGSRIGAVNASEDAVRLRLAGEVEIEGDALLAADGVWSAIRQQVMGNGPATSTGHVAYRALVTQRDLPAALRSHDVTVWIGPRLHVVAYPVRAGQQLNVVAIVEGAQAADAGDWDQAGVQADLYAAMGPVCSALQDLIRAMPAWRLWALHDREPLRGADEMARGRVALLGDAAHAMRPYLAQGAGMALEDASELGRVLAMSEQAGLGVPLALRRYALDRWERCAKVQARARRNGRIFHATGLVRWGRDLSMRMLGERLMDQPWLYAHGA